MKRISRAICTSMLVMTLAFSQTSMPMVETTTIVEAATKAPSLKEEKVTIYLGEDAYQIKLKSVSKDAKVTYESRNSKIAKVDKKGKVTAKKAGDTTISIKVTQSKKTYKLSFAVTVNEPFIELTQSTNCLNVNESYNFKATVHGSDDDIEWSVSDSSVATIGSNGVLKALTSGNVTVTATAGDIEQECEVTIGTNRLGTFSKEVTCYQNTQVWVTLDNHTENDNLTISNSDDSVLTAKAGAWSGNQIPISIKVKEVGKSTITVSVGGTNEMLQFYVNVVEKPVAVKELSAKEIYTKCGPSTVEVKTEADAGEFLGSGFFISDNMVITNYHVIEGAKRIEVSTSKSKYTVSTIIGYNDVLDIAILKVDASKQDYLVMNSSDVAVGDEVYALGSPLGLTGTMTEGMISTASRVMEGVDCVQTTAPLSPGNSGGPLVNTYGEVIGINTMGMSDGQNLNFAVNIKEIQKININHPISIDTYYENYKKSLMNGIPEKAVTEDTFRSQYLDTCQYVPSQGIVTGAVKAVDGGDIYNIEVTETCTPTGIIMSQTLEDAGNTYFAICDINFKIVTLSIPKKGLLYQKLIPKELAPGKYYVVVLVPEDYSGPDVPYQFMLTYK